MMIDFGISNIELRLTILTFIQVPPSRSILLACNTEIIQVGLV